MRSLFVGLALFFAPALLFAGHHSSIRTDEFSVQVEQGLQIAVHHKVRDHGPIKGVVLLIHGAWADYRIWDLPDRSVMDYLARRGYNVFAMDLRGMGDSEFAGSFWSITIPDRAGDAIAVAQHIVANTGKKLAVIGWSEGSLVASMVAAQAPDLVDRVGLLGASGVAYFSPPQFAPLLAELIAAGADRVLLPPDDMFYLMFAVDPATGQPTIDTTAFDKYYAQSEPDSLNVIIEASTPDFFTQVMAPIFLAIRAPVVVADGALDLVAGATRAEALYNMLTTKDKQLVIFKHNAHAFFIEDNFRFTWTVFGKILRDRDDDDYGDRDCESYVRCR
jgi:pimeloyl-ACP methyl ester carboxylesterase